MSGKEPGSVFRLSMKQVQDMARQAAEAAQNALDLGGQGQGLGHGERTASTMAPPPPADAGVMRRKRMSPPPQLTQQTEPGLPDFITEPAPHPLAAVDEPVPTAPPAPSPANRPGPASVETPTQTSAAAPAPEAQPVAATTTQAKAIDAAAPVVAAATDSPSLAANYVLSENGFILPPPPAELDLSELVPPTV